MSRRTGLRQGTIDGIFNFIGVSNYPMPRPQFSLKTMLWLVVVVAAFLGGMAIQRKLDEPKIVEFRECGQAAEAIVTPDGRTWVRFD